MVIRGQPRGGPPPERQLCLSNVNAPKLARRSNPNVEASVETRDEVCLFVTLLHCSAMPMLFFVVGFLRVLNFFYEGFP